MNIKLFTRLGKWRYWL